MRSSGERSEEEEEVKSKSITGSHCVVWWYFEGVLGSLLSKDSANSQSLEGRGMVMVPWSRLCWPAGRPAGHRFPITGSAVNLAATVNWDAHNEAPAENSRTLR